MTRISSPGTSNRTAPPGGPGGQGGFTLLEVVITVAVIAVLAAVAIPRLPDVGGTRIRGEGRRVASMVRLASSRAVTLRRYYRVDLDMEAGEINLSYYGPESVFIRDEDVRLLRLGEARILDVVTVSAGKAVEGVGHIHVSPRGFVEPSLVHLGDSGNRTMTITPRPSGTRVILEEGYIEKENAAHERG